MSNNLDPDQARRIVGPDLGPNCLPRLPADDNGRQRVNTVFKESSMQLFPIQNIKSQIKLARSSPFCVQNNLPSTCIDRQADQLHLC